MKQQQRLCQWSNFSNSVFGSLSKEAFFIRSLEIPERQSKQNPFDVLMALLSAKVPKSRL